MNMRKKLRGGRAGRSFLKQFCLIRENLFKILQKLLLEGHVVGSWPMKRKKNTSNVNDKYTVHLLCQDVSVYPPNMYWPTLMMVTVGPFSSQLLWNIDAFQPSVLACQHRSK